MTAVLQACLRRNNAPINVKPAGGAGGMAWGGDLTFLKNLPSNSLPTGKSFQSNATKFPHPGLHIAVKYPKAGPNKGTIEISPNKTLQSLFMNVIASLKIHVPVTAAVIPFVKTILACSSRSDSWEGARRIEQEKR